MRWRRKRGALAHGIGRTKGGRNTKLHAVCDEKGRPFVLLLTPGNVHDCKVAQRCIEALPPSDSNSLDRSIVASLFLIVRPRSLLPSGMAEVIWCPRSEADGPARSALIAAVAGVFDVGTLRRVATRPLEPDGPPSTKYVRTS